MMRPKRRFYGQPRRRPKRSSAALRSGLVEAVAREPVRLSDEVAGAVAVALGERGGRRDGARGHASDNSSTLSSSSVSSSDHGHVTVATEHRQATPSLVDVASSAESLSKLTVTVDRAKPVSSRLAHARTAAIAAADAAADAKHETSVRRAYVTLGIKDVARIATLPFPASVSNSAGHSN